MTTALYDNQGKRVALGKTLGKGGEGAVFEICDNQNLVAKVYHQSIAPEKARKLNLMAQLRSDRLTNIAAWPVNTLHQTTGGAVCGLIMPKVQGKAVHNLYGPKSRMTHFPTADWRFLISAAANAARAFSVIHEHNHVVGDVNHGNLFVSDQATVKLIDCDSFQIVSQGQAFLCEVGVDMYTPPELQRSRLREVQRTPNHDAFGLAVMIFHLLFMGRHPFSGGYLGIGDMPIPKAISEFRFAYGPEAKERQMASPPATLPLEAASAYVALLFERAFAREGAASHGRPKAQEWVVALDSLAKALKSCLQHSGHYFWNGLTSCPWCLIESRSTTSYFPFAAARPTKNQTTFDLNAVWAQIEQVAPPSVFVIPDKSTFRAGPSLHAVAQGKEFRSGIGRLTSFVGLNTKRKRACQEINGTIQQAKSESAMFATRFSNEMKEDAFQNCKNELETKKSQYLSLVAQRQNKRAELEKNLRSSQLFQFLDRYKIWAAIIPGIGEGRKITLQSYGIETAADIVESSILAIPGFGPSLTSDLVQWRRAVETRFVFNPSIGVNMTDYIEIDRKMDEMRRALETELLSGPTRLLQLSLQINTRRNAIINSITKTMEKIAQLESDLSVL